MIASSCGGWSLTPSFDGGEQIYHQLQALNSLKPILASP